jgi:hypothetical protein
MGKQARPQVIALDEYFARLVANGDPEVFVAFLDALGIDCQTAEEIWFARPRAPFLEFVAEHVTPEDEAT